MQRREGIIRDLRLGRGHRGEERRFPGIRQSDDAGVCDQFEAQTNSEFVAGLARIGMTGGAIGGGLEMGVAEAAVSAVREHRPLA